MIIKRLIWLAIIVTVVMPLAAQTDTEVFAPFVTRLQGELRNNLVRLSWVDSPDIRGPVFIYRSVYPFDSANVGTGSRPVEVAYGVQSYVDEIEIGDVVVGASLYYFVAASDATNQRYEIPIAATNTIHIRITVDGGAYNALMRTSTTSGFLQGDDGDDESNTAELPPVPPGGISFLEAASQGDRVIISFNEGTVKSVVLYRSTRPIRGTGDLLGSVIIQTKVTSPYTDYPVPGIPYYYAAVGEDDIVLGTVEIYPGYNATILPVEVSVVGAASGGASQPETRRGAIRPMPLPELSTSTAVSPAVSGTGSYIETPAPVELSPEATEALNDLPSQSAHKLKSPRVFARDLEAASGEDYTLSVVIKGPFSAKNWEAAKDELIKFLSLPRRPEVSARARFYLGQCWYFLQQPREGLFEFLAIQDHYPAEAMEWIQASLESINAGF